MSDVFSDFNNVLKGIDIKQTKTKKDTFDIDIDAMKAPFEVDDSVIEERERREAEEYRKKREAYARRYHTVESKNIEDDAEKSEDFTQDYEPAINRRTRNQSMNIRERESRNNSIGRREERLKGNLKDMTDSLLLDKKRVEKRLNPETVSQQIMDYSMKLEGMKTNTGAFNFDDDLKSAGAEEFITDILGDVGYYKMHFGSNAEVEKIEKMIGSFANKYNDVLNYKEDQSFGSKFLTGARGIIAPYIDTAIRGQSTILMGGLAGGMKGAGASAVTPFIGDEPFGVAGGALFGASAGFKSELMKEFYRRTAGNTYLELTNMGVREEYAMPFSMLAGVSEGVLEQVQLGFMDKIGKKMVATSVEAFMQKKLGSQAMKKLAKDFGEGWILEALQEGVQELATSTVSKTAKEVENISRKKDNQDLIAEDSWLDVGRAWIETSINSLYATWVFPLGGGAMQMPSYIINSNNVTKDAQAINKGINTAFNNQNDVDLSDVSMFIQGKKVIEKVMNGDYVNNKAKSLLEDAKTKIDTILNTKKKIAQDNLDEGLNLNTESEAEIEEFVLKSNSVDELDLVDAKTPLNDKNLSDFKLAVKKGIKNKILIGLKNGKSELAVAKEIVKEAGFGKTDLASALALVKSVERVNQEIEMKALQNTYENLKKSQEVIDEIELLEAPKEETQKIDTTQADDKNLDDQGVNEPAKEKIDENPNLKPLGDDAEFGSFDVKTVQFDRKSFNFRTETIAEQRDFDADDEILVWEDESGDKYVVNGHNQLEMARKSSTEVLDGTVITHENYSKEQAKALGAMMNIAEGTVSMIDTARVFNQYNVNEETLSQFDIEVDEDIQKALNLANLTDELFEKMVGKQLSVERANMIAEIYQEEQGQMEAYRKIMEKEYDGSRLSLEEIRKLIAEETVEETVEEKPAKKKKQVKKVIPKIGEKSFEVANEKLAKGQQSYREVEPILDSAKKNPYLNNVNVKFIDKEKKVVLTKGDVKRENYPESYAGQEVQITGEQTLRDNGKSEIVLYRGSTADTISEEIIHTLQDRLPLIDNQLHTDIQLWESEVISQANELGYDIPTGKELFAQALIFGELGHAMENPEVANLIAIDDDIVERFTAILGDDLLSAMLGDRPAQIEKSKRVLGGTGMTFSDSLREDLRAMHQSQNMENMKPKIQTFIKEAVKTESTIDFLAPNGSIKRIYKSQMGGYDILTIGKDSVEVAFGNYGTIGEAVDDLVASGNTFNSLAVTKSIDRIISKQMKYIRDEIIQKANEYAKPDQYIDYVDVRMKNVQLAIQKIAQKYITMDRVRDYILANSIDVMGDGRAIMKPVFIRAFENILLNEEFSLNGIEVRDVDELGAVLSIVNNPAFEIHGFVVMKDEKILTSSISTNRTIGQVEIDQGIFQNLVKYAQDNNADGIVAFHNHPSSAVAPSKADKTAFEFYKKSTPDGLFYKDIIIGTNMKRFKYSTHEFNTFTDEFESRYPKFDLKPSDSDIRTFVFDTLLVKQKDFGNKEAFMEEFKTYLEERGLPNLEWFRKRITGYDIENFAKEDFLNFFTGLENHRFQFELVKGKVRNLADLLVGFNMIHASNAVRNEGLGLWELFPEIYEQADKIKDEIKYIFDIGTDFDFYKDEETGESNETNIYGIREYNLTTDSTALMMLRNDGLDFEKNIYISLDDAHRYMKGLFEIPRADFDNLPESMQNSYISDLSDKISKALNDFKSPHITIIDNQVDINKDWGNYKDLMDYIEMHYKESNNLGKEVTGRYHVDFSVTHVDEQTYHIGDEQFDNDFGAYKAGVPLYNLFGDMETYNAENYTQLQQRKSRLIKYDIIKDGQDINYFDWNNPLESSTFRQWFGDSKFRKYDGKKIRPVILRLPAISDTQTFKKHDGFFGENYYLVETPWEMGQINPQLSGSSDIPVFVKAEKILDFDNLSHDDAFILNKFVKENEYELSKVYKWKSLDYRAREKAEYQLSLEKEMSEGFAPEAQPTIEEQKNYYDETFYTVSYKDFKFDAFDNFEGVKHVVKKMFELGFDPTNYGFDLIKSNGVYVVFDKSQMKSINNVGNFDRNDSNIHRQIKPIGIHYGDLGVGRDTKRERMSYGRNTGHFGMGTYYLGANSKDVGRDIPFTRRPMHEIDLSQYNLLKIRDDRTGWEVSDIFRAGNRMTMTLSTEQLESLLKPEIFETGDYRFRSSDVYSDLMREYDRKIEKVWENYTHESTNEEYLEMEKRAKALEAEKAQWKDFDDLTYDLWKLGIKIGIAEDETIYKTMLESIITVQKNRKEQNDDQRTVGNVFLSAFGYDGVDVRGTSLDEYGMGSVIFGNKDGTPRVSPKDYKVNHTMDIYKHNLSQAHRLSDNGIIPEDVYEHPEWYFHMEEPEKESFEILKGIKDNPEATVTIYRGVPQNVDFINAGDWVTLSREVAEFYPRSGDGKVLEMEVKARELYWNGDTIAEFSYFPESIISPADFEEIKEERRTEQLIDDLMADNFQLKINNGLVATHNLTNQNLKRVLDFGAMPVPSIAVYNESRLLETQSTLEGFGRNSFVFRKDTVTTDDIRNVLFNGDVASIRFPQVTSKELIKASEVADRVENMLEYDYDGQLRLMLYNVSQILEEKRFVENIEGQDIDLLRQLGNKFEYDLIDYVPMAFILRDLVESDVEFELPDSIKDEQNIQRLGTLIETKYRYGRRDNMATNQAESFLNRFEEISSDMSSILSEKLGFENTGTEKILKMSNEQLNELLEEVDEYLPSYFELQEFIEEAISEYEEYFGESEYSKHAREMAKAFYTEDNAEFFKGYRFYERILRSNVLNLFKDPWYFESRQFLNEKKAFVEKYYADEHFDSTYDKIYRLSRKFIKEISVTRNFFTHRYKDTLGDMQEEYLEFNHENVLNFMIEQQKKMKYGRWLDRPDETRKPETYNGSDVVRASLVQVEDLEIVRERYEHYQEKGYKVEHFSATVAEVDFLARRLFEENVAYKLYQAVKDDNTSVVEAVENMISTAKENNDYGLSNESDWNQLLTLADKLDNYVGLYSESKPMRIVDLSEVSDLVIKHSDYENLEQEYKDRLAEANINVQTYGEVPLDNDKVNKFTKAFDDFLYENGYTILNESVGSYFGMGEEHKFYLGDQSYAPIREEKVDALEEFIHGKKMKDFIDNNLPESINLSVTPQLGFYSLNGGDMQAGVEMVFEADNAGKPASLGEGIQVVGKSFQLKIPHINFTENEQFEQMSFPETVEKADISNELKELLNQKEYNYAVKKNINTYLSALKYLDEVGIDEATDAVIDPKNEGTPELFALAQSIIAYRMYMGETREAERLIETVSIKAKNLGQAIQVLSMWNRYTPEGIVRYASRVIRGSMSEKDAQELDKITGKVTREINKANKEAVDKVDLENPLVEIVEMDDADMQWEKFMEEWKKSQNQNNLTAEELLAQKVIKTTQERPEPKEKSALEIMVDTLFEVAKESPLPDKSQSIKEDKIKLIADAIKNRAEYREVWSKAKEIVQNRLEADGREIEMRELEDYFEKSINRTFPDAKLNQVIKDELKKLEVSISEIVKKHYTVNSNVRRQLMDAIIEQTDLTETEARILEQHIYRQMKDLTKEAKEKILGYKFTERETREKRSAIDAIIELSNLGAFKNDNYKSLVAEKLGLPTLNKETLDLIHAQAQYIQTLEPESREQKIEIARLHEMIARNQKKSTLEYIDFTQTLAQLLNPKTIIRNLGGNSGFAMIETLITDNIKVPIDIVASMKTGRRTAKFMPVKKVKAWTGGFKQGWEEGLYDAMNHIDTTENTTRFDFKSTRMYNEGIMSGLETILNISLRATDRAYYKASVEEALIEMRTINGDKLSEEMLETAHVMGLYRTFQDDTRLAEFLVSTKRLLNLNKGFGMGSMVLKYPKTPANLLMRGLDYSPFGVVMTLYKLFADTTNNQYLKQKMAVDGMGRALVGTSILATGALLYSLGIITRRRDDDKDWDIYSTELSSGLREYQVNQSLLRRYLTGAGDYRTIRGDKLVSYDWFQPTAITIGMGADMYANKDVGSMLTTGISTFEAGVESITSQPLLSNLVEAFQKDTIGEAFTNIAQQVPDSFIPTLFSQTQIMLDPTVYQNWIKDDWVKTMINKASRKVPFLSSKIAEPSITNFGEIATYYDAGDKSWLSRFFDSYFSPAIASEYEPTPNEEMVLDLYESTDETRHAPRGINWSYKIDIGGGKKAEIRLTEREYRVLSEWVGKNVDKEFDRIRKDYYGRYGEEIIIDMLNDSINEVNRALKDRLFKMYQMKDLENVDVIGGE